MAAVSDPGKTTQGALAVAVNDRGQHALWQAGLDLPPGWRRESEGMSRQACLDGTQPGRRTPRVPRSPMSCSPGRRPGSPAPPPWPPGKRG
jgi:uncharacterized protein YbdZ (MbtH family)